MTAPDEPADDLASFTGDPESARLLRTSLTRLRDDPGVDLPVDVRRDIGAVLAGSMSMRDLADVPAFRDAALQGMREVQAAWQQLTPEQRAAEVSAGRARR